MHLIQIDPLCIQPLKRCITGIDHVPATQASSVSVRGVCEVELGREDDVVSFALAR